jgi:hypothetical protein
MDVMNTGPRESRKRRFFGLAMLATGICLAVALAALHADRSWRLILFIPFWLAALGWLQAREKT